MVDLNSVNQNLKDWERYSLIGYISQYLEDVHVLISDYTLSERERLAKLHSIDFKFNKFLEVSYVQKSQK